MQPIYLYDESFFLGSRIKLGLKRLLGKGARGPEAVCSNLCSGLASLRVDFKINLNPESSGCTACILSGVDVLNWAISQKAKGKIKKIIAGPNLVITPDDEGGIIKSPQIDRIIVPSQWVKDFYVSFAPELANKIFVWAAGVEIPELSDVKKEFDFLIYNKTQKDSGLYEAIESFLEDKQQKAITLRYGGFKQQEYFKALNKSKYLIYLSESESQGLAMFEAWARNVPSLVWNRGFMEYEKYAFNGNTASPYLSKDTGMEFKDFENFKEIFPKFIAQQYSAREWVKNNATNEISAKKYLEIINA